MPGDSEDSSSRRPERISILGDLRGEIMLPQPMVVRDISSRGAQIETTFPLQPDSLHDLRLSLGIRTVVLKGRVAHCRGRDDGLDVRSYVSGVEFTDPPEHVDRVINAFIQALKDVDSRSD